MNLVVQIIGCFAVAFWVFSIQNKKQSHILFFQLLANVLYFIQYSFLNVFAAASMNMLSSFRSFVFYYKRKNDKDISKMWLIIFIILTLVLGIIFYQNYLSLIPIIATLLYTVSTWMKDSKWIRLAFIIAALAWIYYNYIVGAYISIVGNVFEIISGITALIKFKK